MVLSKGDTRFVFFAMMISNLIYPQVSKKMNEDHLNCLDYFPHFCHFWTLDAYMELERVKTMRIDVKGDAVFVFLRLYEDN